MRLTVLGGSAASPNAGAGCAGFLVEHGATRVVLDFGPGVLPELRRHADVRTLSGIVISHMNLDHVLDLLALRHALAYNPVPAPRPVPVWLPPGGGALHAAAAAPFDAHDDPGTFARTVSIHEYAPAEQLVFGESELTVSFAPTVHYVPGYAMRIVSAMGSTLGYTGDTGPGADLASFFAGVDLLIAEATLRHPPVPDTPTRGSLTAAEAGQLATASRARRLLLTHFWEESDPAWLRRAAMTKFAGPVDLARPGWRLDLTGPTAAGKSRIADCSDPGDDARR